MGMKKRKIIVFLSFFFFLFVIMGFPSHNGGNVWCTRLSQDLGSGLTYSIVWGDYDGDTDLDVAVGNFGQNYLYINNGDGTFTEQEQFGARNTTVVLWGNFDGVGFIDLAVGNSFGPNALYINNGDGTFTERLEFGIENGDTWALAADDYGNDGDLDVAVGNYLGDNYLYINNGDGTFTETQKFGTSNYTYAMDWGDYDADGDLDMVVGNYYDPNLLFINNGDGTFTETQEFGSRYTRTVAWGDFDLDNDLDLAVGNTVGNALYINNGDGTFTEQEEFGVGETWAMDWGDWNNDLYPDLAVGNDGESYIFINNQDGTFQILVFGNDSIYDIKWGDFESDYDEDLVAAVYDGDNFIFKNDISTFQDIASLFDSNTFFVAGDNAYCTDVLGSAKIAFGLGEAGTSENPEGRTDVILTATEHDTGNLIPVGGPAINPVADEFNTVFNITYTYVEGVSFTIHSGGESISLNLEDYPGEDICIVYLGTHGPRTVMLVWGYGWTGSYAGSLYIGDPPHWAAHSDDHMLLIRWIDTNSDGLVQSDEITVEKTL
jgi:hypothetical protein